MESGSGRISRRVMLRRMATAGTALSGLGLLSACGSSAVEVAEEPTVTRVPVEGAPTDVPAEFVAGASPAAEDGEQVAEASPAGDDAAQGGATTVELEGYDIGWRPETLSVPVGGTIKMYNSGAAQHNFAVEGYNDDAPVDLPVGGDIVEWQVPDDLTPGEYVFYCAVPGHREAGMEGVLTITEGDTQVAGAEGEGTAAEQGVEGASVVQLEGFDIGWTQTDLEVPSGGTIEMTNVGSAHHNFAIDEYKSGEVLVELPVDGEPVSWQVPADLAAGSYTFFCAVPGHRQAGMEGTLTVV